MPTNREKLDADIELIWAQILGAVRERQIGYIFRLLRKVIELIKKRDITL
jgi:hypothetical protein